MPIKQLILTGEEVDEYEKMQKRLEDLPSEKKLNAFAWMIANKLPIDSWSGKNTPWGCIYENPTGQTQIEHEWYCDDCPAQMICSRPQHYSK